ncbi:MAG TPA: HWE histidine kinase domain-containing protein [Acetobacteraceae bacterium]|nr:HWE histidine kinase domain-containing protein [Acetobacteraceae bacterium]
MDIAATLEPMPATATPDRHAERRADDHQAMLQAVFDTTPECIKVVAPDGSLLEMNRAGLEMIGAASLDAVRGACVFDMIAPEDREAWRQRHDRVCRGEHLSWSFDLVLQHGLRRHMETHAAPFPMPDGSTAHLAVTRDITERRRDRQRLEESERRLRDLLDALPAAIYTTDRAGRLTFYNQAAALLAGCEPRLGEDSWCVAWRLLDSEGAPIPHDQCPMAITLKQQQAVRGTEVMAERPDGQRVPILPYPALLRDAAGAVVGGVNMLVDISARKDAERRQKLLVNELNHRVKNTLATVQSIAAQTFRGLADTPARQWFDARLLALSQVHDILNRENWEGADLGDIILQTIAPLGDPQRNRFTLDGPELRLPPGMALSVAMALHELCTNAAKYGALSGAAGQVAITWSAEPHRRLRFRWEESGGPPVRPPAARGFGSRLIERGLARELGGSARLDFAPSGVLCEIDAPLP